MSKAFKQSSHVGFLGFFKLNLLYGLALGQLAGAAYLVAAIAGAPVHLNLGDWKIDGLPAAIGILMLLPVVLGLISLVIAPVLFVPFTLACRLLGGFKVSRAT